MTYQNKLTLKITANILGVSLATIRRIAKSDKTFPEIEIIGRSKYVDSKAFYKWLSDQVGFKVSAPDKAISSPQLQKMLDKSHTWVWVNVKNKTLPKPFKIGRLNFWITTMVDYIRQVAGKNVKVGQYSIAPDSVEKARLSAGVIK